MGWFSRKDLKKLDDDERACVLRSAEEYKEMEIQVCMQLDSIMGRPHKWYIGAFSTKRHFLGRRHFLDREKFGDALSCVAEVFDLLEDPQGRAEYLARVKAALDASGNQMTDDVLQALNNSPSDYTRSRPQRWTSTQGRDASKDYKVIEEIGSGGMGRVLKVRRAADDRDYALKLSNRPVKSGTASQFARESLIWFGARHIPQVVDVHEVLTWEGGQLGILMEYIPRGSLRQLIDLDAWAHEERLTALFDVATGLSACRAIAPEFGHLDLKPENCLVAEHGLVKLADFGLAQTRVSTDLRELQLGSGRSVGESILHVHDDVSSCAGTPLYMAPEQVIGGYKDLGPADVYAFGLMAFEILTGRHPVQADSLSAVFDAHLRGELAIPEAPPKGVTQELMETLVACLEKDPGARPAIESIPDQILQALPRRARAKAMSVSDRLCNEDEDIARKAASYRSLGLTEEAKSLLEALLERDLTNGLAWLELADICLAQMQAENEAASAASTSDTPTASQEEMRECALAYLTAQTLGCKLNPTQEYAMSGLLIAGWPDAPRKGPEAEAWVRGRRSDQLRRIGKSEPSDTGDRAGAVTCLCVNCGALKTYMICRCATCGFYPASPEEIYHTWLLRLSDWSSEPAWKDFPKRMSWLKKQGEDIELSRQVILDRPGYAESLEKFCSAEGAMYVRAAAGDDLADPLSSLVEEPESPSSAGRERPGLGSRVVDYVFRKLRIDDEWSVRYEDGFVWWAGWVAQRLWFDEPVEDQGMMITRVHAETDVSVGLSDAPNWAEKLSLMGQLGGLSGYVKEEGEDAETITLRASVTVHDQNVEWLEDFFAWVAAVQVTEGHVWSPWIAEKIGGQMAGSAHPESGRRQGYDGIINIMEEVIQPAGAEPSRFAGREMLSLAKLLDSPPAVRVSGDDEGIGAEFPFGDHTCLIQASAHEEHPRMGNGVTLRLYIPAGGDTEEDAERAIEWNGIESARPLGHFVGSWVANPNGMLFVAFIPNAMHKEGVMTNLMLSFVQRARRVAEDVTGSSW